MSSGISSMTGFARVDGAHEGWRYAWELRSVNGRGLEWRCRLPGGYDGLEPDLRKAVKKQLSRGSVTVNLTLSNDQPGAQYRVNEAVLSNAIAMIESLNGRLKCALPQPEGILSLRGVMEPAEEVFDKDAQAALEAALLADYNVGVEALATARRNEGTEMTAVLENQFATLEKLTADAAANAALAPAALRQRLEKQLSELLVSDVAEERLAQEVALLAIKADIREELDRLRSHIATGRALLKKSEPVGRELDFLTQEFNREANTLCSKAPDMDLKRIGLELKRVIDQMREQVQNIE